MLAHSMLQCQKITFINILEKTLRESGSCQTQDGRHKFSMILAFAGKFKSYQRQHMLAMIFLEVIVCLVHFWDNICQIPESEKSRLGCQSFLPVKTEIHEKGRWLSSHLSLGLHKGCSWDNHLSSRGNTNVFRTLASLSPRMLKRCVLKDQDFRQ